MMNMFPRFQFSAQMLLHDISMFTLQSSITLYLFIFMLIFTSWLKSEFFILWQFVFSKATSRAVLNPSAFNSILWNIEVFITDITYKIRTLPRLGFFYQIGFFNSPSGLTSMRTESSTVFSWNKFIFTNNTSFHVVQYSHGNKYCNSY